MSKKILTILIIIIFVICCIFICSSYIKKSKIQKHNDEKDNKKNIIFSDKKNKIKKLDYNKIEENINKRYNISDREILLKKYEDKYELLVGNNINELENYYYDFCIEYIKNKDVNIYINKLWKIKINENLYNENYIYEMIDLVNNVLAIKLSEKEAAKLSEIIIKNYTNLKRALLVDSKVNLINLQIDNLNYNFSADKGKLKLKIEYLE